MGNKKIILTVIFAAVCFWAGTSVFAQEYTFLEKSDIPKVVMPPREFKEGKQSYSGCGVNISYNSRYLGYQSLINRDFLFYGSKLEQEQYDDKKWSDICVLRDVDYDGLADVVAYADGKLLYHRNMGNTSFGEPVFLADVSLTSDFCMGDVNGDGRYDIILPDLEKGTIDVRYMDENNSVFAKSLFESRELSDFCDETTKLQAGDFDGDRFCDIIAVKNDGNYIILYSDSTGRFEETLTDKLCFMGKEIGNATNFSIEDFNSDNLADIALLNCSEYKEGILFLFTRLDDTFGPKEYEKEDVGVDNLFGKVEWGVKKPAIRLLAGTLNNDDVADVAVLDKDSIIMRYQFGEASYDYSFHLIKEGGLLRCYSGARWGTKSVKGDGDHTIYSESRDGGLTWFRNIKDPVFYKPYEIGLEKSWWSINSMDPEVVKVGGVYYMYTQQQINPGLPLDTGEIAESQADRFMLSTSLDGEIFNPHPERGVVVNITSGGTKMNMHHHEVIYVPDDVDGKPWWLYYVAAGANAGVWRIRSSDPTTFDWEKKERLTAPFSQIGNQIGYIDEAPGGRLFVRPTFIRGKGPILQVSRDGLSWTSGDGETPVFATINPEAERVPEKNRDTFFMGMATENGTGRILPEADGSYRILIATTSSTAPTAPTIFSAEGGLCEVKLKFDEN